MAEIAIRPSLGRMAIAFFAAVATPALCLAIGLGVYTHSEELGGIIQMLMVFGFFGSLFALVIGLPVLLVLQRFLPPSLWLIVPVAAAVAGVPSMIMGMTIYGFTAGALGGAVFWAISTGGRVSGTETRSRTARPDAPEVP